MSKIHITTNIDPRSSVTSSLWTLFGSKEPERVAVRFNNKEYVIVLDDPVFFEAWSLDENGELNELEQTIKPQNLNEVNQFLENIL
jgi:hypothetical protein